MLTEKHFRSLKISPISLPDRKFHPVNFNWPQFQGVQLTNPSAVLPVSLENKVSIPEARLWMGSKNDHKLLSSSNWLLVDIEDKSRLVYSTNTSNFLNNFDSPFGKKIDSLSEENVLDISFVNTNPRILIPRETGIQIGVSRLTDLGKVTQKNYVSTYTIKKIVDDKAQPDSTILYQNGEIHSFEHQLTNTLECLHDSLMNEDLQYEKITFSMLLKILILPFHSFLKHKKLFLGLFAGRIIFSLVYRKFLYWHKFSCRSKAKS